MRRIRTMALCLLRRGDEFLIHVDYDKVKDSHYARSLGGGVEFGERAEEAIVREIREELGAEIENIRLFRVLENLFTLEGKASHEIVFFFDAEFVGKTLYQCSFLEGYEGGIEKHFTATWMTLKQMEAEKIRFVPETLYQRLATRGNC